MKKRASLQKLIKYYNIIGNISLLHIGFIPLTN